VVFLFSYFSFNIPLVVIHLSSFYLLPFLLLTQWSNNLLHISSCASGPSKAAYNQDILPDSSCIKTPNLRPDGIQHWASVLVLLLILREDIPTLSRVFAAIHHFRILSNEKQGGREKLCGMGLGLFVGEGPGVCVCGGGLQQQHGRKKKRRKRKGRVWIWERF